MFVGFAGVLDLGDADGGATTVGAVVCIVEVAHVVLSIQNHGDDFVPAETQEDTKVIVVALLKLGSFHVRGIKIGMVIVILKHGKDVDEFGVWDEYCRDPMVKVRWAADRGARSRESPAY